MPQPCVQAMESAQGFMARVAKIDVRLCPCCKVGRLRAVLHRSGWGGAIRMHNVMLQATMPVGFDVEWLGDAARPVII